MSGGAQYIQLYTLEEPGGGSCSWCWNLAIFDRPEGVCENGKRRANIDKVQYIPPCIIRRVL